MAGNTWGKYFRLTTFGESHGKAIGGVIDGCPAGVVIDELFIQSELERRKPGQSKITSPREESDRVELLSGIFEGKSTGTPIAFLIRNNDQKSSDYNSLKNVFRPSHADYTYTRKYGIRDHRGGGRSSARETASRVVGGAIAQLVLKHYSHIEIMAYTSSVGHIELKEHYSSLDMNLRHKTLVKCPDLYIANQMEALIQEVKQSGDTIGGTISCIIKGTPIGLGDPVFDKLQASLAKAMLSINACKGFEYGSGFQGTNMRGSEHNDAFTVKNGSVSTATNYSGGIQGGISNGEDIYFKLAFKPVATILQNQQTLDKEFQPSTIKAKGRHDPCVLPRAVPIVEAMAALCLVDALISQQTTHLVLPPKKS